jgi:hypothetical protein
MGGQRIFTAVLTVTAALLAAAPAAHATFHLMSIREVYPGSAAAPGAEYVELQMYSPGQNHVQGHTITVYDAAGAETGSATFAADVAQGANQSTLLAATPAAESQFGVAADVAMPASDSLDPAGGAACWESLDCVAWGSFHGSVLAPVGTPADPAGIPDGLALRRTIAPNCSTLLDGGDDSNNSAADLLDAIPAPRPNSVVPSEHACSQAAPGGNGGKPGSGGGGNAAGRRPQTSIRRGPPHVSRQRSATFRFVSDQPGSTFLCRLDGRPFRNCHSPFTLRHLRPGRHLFRVEARAPGGATDRSPAAWSFRVLPRRR